MEATKLKPRPKKKAKVKTRGQELSSQMQEGLKSSEMVEEDSRQAAAVDPLSLQLTSPKVHAITISNDVVVKDMLFQNVGDKVVKMSASTTSERTSDAMQNEQAHVLCLDPNSREMSDSRAAPDVMTEVCRKSDDSTDVYLKTNLDPMNGNLSGKMTSSEAKIDDLKIVFQKKYEQLNVFQNSNLYNVERAETMSKMLSSLRLEEETNPLSGKVQGASSLATNVQETQEEKPAAKSIQVITVHQTAVGNDSDQIVAEPLLDDEIYATGVAIPSAPTLIDLGGMATCSTNAVRDNHVLRDSEQERESRQDYPQVVYPKLELHLDDDVDKNLVPYSEEDLALFCPNPQLNSSQVFVDNFLKSATNLNIERHVLYELLMTYLKTKRSLTNTRNQLNDLTRNYMTHKSLMWNFETKEITGNARCGDNVKVTQNYAHRVAEFLPAELAEVSSSLKQVRQLLEEAMSTKTYNCQLARVHVEHNLYLLMHSVPELLILGDDAPVTSWVPWCPPGNLDSYCSHIREALSVLFFFERQHKLDQEFSDECRKWLRQLTSVFLRVSSLSDHHFLFNHLLRCPPGVGAWGADLLFVMSPIRTNDMLQSQFHTRGNSNYSQEWGVWPGLHGNWGGPVLDHFVTLLENLMLPIKERESFLSSMDISEGASSPTLVRLTSVPWAFIDEADGEHKVVSPTLLEESDYIAFFNQFPFKEMFRYVLRFTGEDDFNMAGVTSHQIMQLLAFCTRLVRLLGTAFSTLRLARYKEFIKRVGQTIRHTVLFVDDYWSTYRTYRLQCRDNRGNIPMESSSSESIHSLNRLQLEFDNFVLRAIKWILTAQKLGAWQFLADLPYGSVSLSTAWKVFWILYCKPNSSDSVSGAASCSTGSDPVNVSSAFLDKDLSTCHVTGILEALDVGSHKEEFVDRLMKTYTSEAVYLLTTLVNMVRARSCDPSVSSCDNDAERKFIDAITLEIFECTHVVEYAREAYFKTGSDLLDSIAVVHPFVISTLLGRVETAIGAVGENCILLFMKLSLHLWVPTHRDVQLVKGWLLDYPLSSSENKLARNILSGLNWGSKIKDGSFDLVLPWSLHCFISLSLVEALSRHLPSHPGGRDYTPGSVSLVGKYATRFTTSQTQLEFKQWAWGMVLMLKLHPHQVTSHSRQLLSPATLVATSHGGSSQSYPGPEVDARERSGIVSRSSGVEVPPWVQVDPSRGDLILPNLDSASCVKLAELRDAVKNEGLLAYYVAMSITDIGTDTDHFVTVGLSMLQSLVDDGHHTAMLRLLANVLPCFFKHTKFLMQDTSFVQILLALVNTDTENASIKEKWITGSVPFVTKRLSALIQMQVEEASSLGGGVGGGEVLRFWLVVLFGCPMWYKEKSILFLLNNICMAAFFRPRSTDALENTLLESYQALNPLRPKKGIMSSVYSSMASMVWQDSNTPSLYNTIPHNDYPWLSYSALCVEQRFEEEEKIWSGLLLQLKKDKKASVETALKKAFSELNGAGSFGSSHLCLYRWAELCTSLDHMHPLTPLVWQRFFTLYLARARTDTTDQEKGGFGPRLFASSHNLAMCRKMRTALSTHCRQLQAHITSLEEPDWWEQVGEAGPSDERRDTLRTFFPKCLKFFQTLRLWLEEPRLHSPSLYLLGLPSQYDSKRLSTIFEGNKSPWLEFVPVWKLKDELNSLVGDWMLLAAYQKSLPYKPQPPWLQHISAGSRIHNRLQGSSTAKLAPVFQYCHPPFSPLTQDTLLSKDMLTAAVVEDMYLLFNQAKSFSSYMTLLNVYDEEFVGGVPELYTNEPRQFHVRVQCRSRFNRSHQCVAPATIVFRFNEMTISSKWETQLMNNRTERDRAVMFLSSPIAYDLVQMVVRMEHTVAELSKMATQNKGVYHEVFDNEASANIPLQNGVALFYEVLSYLRMETRQYPPSNQFLTSCISILGQAFIQQDPLQASNVLNLLLTVQGNSDILAPLFQPNLCPEQFVRMYGSVTDLAAKLGPTVAFSVLTKFNVPLWLDTYNRSVLECDQLITFVCEGLSLCGPQPSGCDEILVDIYSQHFVLVVNHNFPQSFQKALQLVLEGTERGIIAVSAWAVLCIAMTNPKAPDQTHLGLQLIHDSLNMLSNAYATLRLAHQCSVYSIVLSSYVSCVRLFMRQLCFCLISRLADDIALDSTRPEQGLRTSWTYTMCLFEPWIGIIHPRHQQQQQLLLPCVEEDCVQLRDVMEMFVECVAFMHSKLQEHSPSLSVLYLLWMHYCSSVALPNVPRYILDIYHSCMEELPWRTLCPDLALLDSMMKLKIDQCVPSQCFIFLGTIFPLIDWLHITALYSIAECPADAAVKFHIMVLQLLLMLTSERAIMENDDSGMPELILCAQDFHWRLIDAKMFSDVIDWQKNNCNSASILHKGSSLSLSLRLLKAAAGFPSSSGPCPSHQLNDETWEKRFLLVRAIVELVSNATHRRDNENQEYSDCVSNLFQLAVDISTYEPEELSSPHIISLMQDVLSLLNFCSNENDTLEKILTIMFKVFDQLPGCNLLTLPTITAACQAVASIPLMARLVEHVIDCHFQALPDPAAQPLQLLHDTDIYGWKSVVDFLILSDDVVESVMTGSFNSCCILLLHGLLLKDLLCSTSMEGEMRLLVKSLHLCSNLKPKLEDEAKLFILWFKPLDILIRQLQNVSDSLSVVLPHLITLATIFMRFAEDKCKEGLFSKIGFGKKSIYTSRFKMIARSLGVFLLCQMPIDSNGQVQLRIIPNAPGHIKDCIQSGKASKQNEQAYQSLESLLTNKGYSSVSNNVAVALCFISNPANSILNCLQLLVMLTVSLYPEFRFLDLLRC